MEFDLPRKIHKQTKVVTIKVKFNTKDYITDEQIQSAIEKGIYYGLDVRRIASPKDIKKITFI